jgi:hypothetical protein
MLSGQALFTGNLTYLEFVYKVTGFMDRLYIFEFKLGGKDPGASAEDALEQIEKKDYLGPWKALLV